jgi:hypothetical protein
MYMAAHGLLQEGADYGLARTWRKTRAMYEAMAECNPDLRHHAFEGPGGGADRVEPFRAWQGGGGGGAVAAVVRCDGCGGVVGVLPSSPRSGRRA